jgi:hypothetical protein
VYYSISLRLRAERLRRTPFFAVLTPDERDRMMDLPEGCGATRRLGADMAYTIVMNFKEVEQELTLPASLRKAVFLAGEGDGRRLTLEAFGYAVLRTEL